MPLGRDAFFVRAAAVEGESGTAGAARPSAARQTEPAVDPVRAACGAHAPKKRERKVSVFGVKVNPFGGGGRLLNQRRQAEAVKLFFQFAEIGGDFRVFG